MNVFLFITLFLNQNVKYHRTLISNVDDPYSDVIKAVKLMDIAGETVKWILILTVGLLFINLRLYKNWIVAKRWIAEPILVMIIFLILSYSYYSFSMIELREEIENTIK